MPFDNPAAAGHDRHLPDAGAAVAGASDGRARRLWLLPIGAILVDAGLILASAAMLRAFDGSRAAAVTALAGTVLFVLIGLGRRDYTVACLLTRGAHGPQALGRWLLAFVVALALASLTRGGPAALCGIPLQLGLAGAILMPAGRALLTRGLRPLADAGHFAGQPTMVVGAEAEVAAFLARHAATPGTRRVIGAAVLRDDATTLADDLSLAVAIARILQPTDVLLLLPWREHMPLERSVDALRQLPAAIHLGTPLPLGRYAGRLADHAGAMASIELVGRPLSPRQARGKRAFDVLAAGAALVVLSPVLALIAVAIRLDSPGPVLFRQRRYGFNQQPFRIVKFRTMTTLEDDAGLRQAIAGDPRITRIGRLLRRTSLDELPQLLNVLAGDMSLIGPRPHALAHDRAFERLVDLYGRRYNMRPGITGWAQVRGFRGETDTREKIEGRVAHDLAYIDNWSPWLDLSILLRTLLSPTTFRNAK